MQIIDLSHEVHTDMPQWPTLRPQVFVRTVTHQAEHGVISHSILILTDHSGTHIDSTLHYHDKGYSAEKIPLEYLYGDGVLIDVSYKKKGDYVFVKDVEDACRKTEIDIKPLDVVLFRTDGSKLWGTPEYMNFNVGIHVEVIRWLYERGVRVYGVDEIGPDVEKHQPAHLLMRELAHHHIENLTNLEKIPKPRFKFVGLPLKIRGSSASPIRAAAIIE